MGTGAGKRLVAVVAVAVVTLTTACSTGGGSASQPATSVSTTASVVDSETSENSTSDVAVPSIATTTAIEVPVEHTPRFGDQFECAYLTDGDGSELPPGFQPAITSGPAYCDDPILRALLNSGQVWFADPGNGRPCLSVMDWINQGTSLWVSCQAPPSDQTIGPFCETMRSIDSDLVSENPMKGKNVIAALERNFERLEAGDAKDWMENLLQLWSKPADGSSDAAMRNMNGFGYVEIVCGFSYTSFNDLPMLSWQPVRPSSYPSGGGEATTGEWMTIFASIPISEYLEVERIVTDWTAQGLGPQVFDSREYAALNDGYWVLGFGGMTSRTEAEDVCAEVLGSPAMTFMPDCQVRQI